MQLLSPFGASFGGPVLTKGLTYKQIEEISRGPLAIADEEVPEEFHMSVPIRACWISSPDALESVLRRSGFSCEYRELTSVLDPRALQISHRARRTRVNAIRNGTTVKLDGPVEDFLSVLDATYAKHRARPTHSHEEFVTS